MDLRYRNRIMTLPFTKLFRQICIEGYHRHKLHSGLSESGAQVLLHESEW